VRNVFPVRDSLIDMPRYGSLYTLLFILHVNLIFLRLHIGTEHLMIDAGSDWGKFIAYFF
jgi:hypothetical protein